MLGAQVVATCSRLNALTQETEFEWKSQPGSENCFINSAYQHGIGSPNASSASLSSVIVDVNSRGLASLVCLIFVECSAAAGTQNDN